MNLINFTIVTPEQKVLSVEAKSITVPTNMGEITILPGHEPLVTIVSPGELSVLTGDKRTSMHVAGGFLTVSKDNTVSLLADAAERFEDLDINRAEAAKLKAKETLAGTNLTDQEFAAAAAALERSLSRIRVARKRSHARTSPITGQGVLNE